MTTATKETEVKLGGICLRCGCTIWAKDESGKPYCVNCNPPGNISQRYVCHIVPK